MVSCAVPRGASGTSEHTRKLPLGIALMSGSASVVCLIGRWCLRLCLMRPHKKVCLLSGIQRTLVSFQLVTEWAQVHADVTHDDVRTIVGTVPRIWSNEWQEEHPAIESGELGQPAPPLQTACPWGVAWGLCALGGGLATRHWLFPWRGSLYPRRRGRQHPRWSRRTSQVVGARQQPLRVRDRTGHGRAQWEDHAARASRWDGSHYSCSVCCHKICRKSTWHNTWKLQDNWQMKL